MSVASFAKKQERFPRLIVQLLISYLIIVSLGVGIFILPARNAVRMLREQTLSDQTAAVQRYARNADSTLSLFANIATAFLSDPPTAALAHARSDDPNRLFYHILTQLNQYNTMYGNIFDQIYFYDSRRDNLLSVAGLSMSESSFQGKLNAYMTRESFDRMLRRGTPGQPDLFAQGQTVYVVHTLPFNYPDDRYILVAFSVPLQNFFYASTRYEQVPLQCGMYLTASGVFLGESQDIGPMIVTQAGALNTSSVQHVELSGEGSLFLIRSARNDRYYYFHMPQNPYNQQVADFTQSQVLSLAAFLAVSILIILFSLRQQYRPLKRLLEEIDRDSVDSLSTHDYGMILGYLSSLKKERDNYKSLFIDRNPRLRQLLLSALLIDHTLTGETAQESLRLLEIDFPHPFFVVIVIDVLDDSELFFAPIDNPEDYSLFLAENVLHDLIPENSKPVFFEMDGSLLCLLNLCVEESPQATLSALQDQLLFAADFLTRELNLFCRYSVSSLHGNMGAFADAYAEALECARSIHSQNACVLLYDFMRSKNTREFQYFPLYAEDQSRRLVSALRGGQAEKAQAVVRLVFQEAQDRSDLHPLVYKGMCRSMACSFIDVLSEMGIASEPLEHQLLDLLDADTRAIAPKVMKDRMLALCASLAGLAQEAGLDRQERLIGEINAYVQAHYADPNLGVTGIAEVFSMSVSGLSGFYSRHSDVGLCKYINRVRIQQAARLLVENPDMPLDEVASKVGYANTRSFSRVFTAEMQCSPGKYRQAGA